MSAEWDNLSFEDKIQRLKEHLHYQAIPSGVAPSVVEFDANSPEIFPSANTLSTQLGLTYQEIVYALGFHLEQQVSRSRIPPICECGNAPVSNYAIIEIYHPGNHSKDGSSQFAKPRERLLALCYQCLHDHNQLEAEHRQRLEEENRGTPFKLDDWTDPQGFLLDRLSGG